MKKTIIICDVCAKEKHSTQIVAYNIHNSARDICRVCEVAIVRRHIEKGLLPQFITSCTYCNGLGYVKDYDGDLLKYIDCEYCTKLLKEEGII